MVPVLRLPRLGKSELIIVHFVRLFDLCLLSFCRFPLPLGVWEGLCLFGLCLFRFVGFLFLLGSGKGCGLWLWHSLDFSLTFFVIVALPGLFSYPFFHPDKCSTLRISRSRRPIHASYTLTGHTLETEDSTKSWGRIGPTFLGTDASTRSQRKETVCWASYGGIWKLETRIQRPLITSQLINQDWSTVVQYGVPTPRKPLRSWKKYSVEQQDKSPIATEIQATWPLCWIISSGSL